MRPIRIVIIAAAFLAAVPQAASAATWYVKSGSHNNTPPATSCQRADVDATINDAAVVDGDIIQLPTGNCSWTTPISISKGIWLRGGGARTTIDGIDGILNFNGSGNCDNAPLQTCLFHNAGLNDLITVTESSSPNGRVIITDIQFIEDTGGPHTTQFAMIKVNGGGGRLVAIGHNSFHVFQSDMVKWEVSRGVFWKNYGSATVGGGGCLNQIGFVRMRTFETWNVPVAWGNADANGDQALYVEDNISKNVSQAFDLDQNSRQVNRYNRIINSGTLIHGGTGRSARKLEVYNNQYIKDNTPLQSCSGQDASVSTWIKLRGGTAVIHGNTFDSPTAGSAFTQGGTLAFELANLRQNAGNFACWSGGYPAPDSQVGWGCTSSPCGTNQGGFLMDIEPVWVWNNNVGNSTENNNFNSPSRVDWDCNNCQGGNAGACGCVGNTQTDAAACFNRPSATDYILPGREYFTALTTPTSGTGKPGYTAYQHPHPVTVEVDSGGAPPPGPTGSPRRRANGRAFIR